jgi:fumarate reductase subunit D
VVSALLVPIHILIFGFALPFGWLLPDQGAYSRLLALVSHPLARLYLLLLVALSLFHCAHRIRHTLYDLGLRGARTAIAVLCYGAALVGGLAALFAILGVG